VFYLFSPFKVGLPSCLALEQELAWLLPKRWYFLSNLPSLACNSSLLQAEAGANVAIWYNSNKKAIEEAAIIEKEYSVKCASA
jgi:hypothetical protein